MRFIGRIMVADLDLSMIYALLAHSVEHFHGKEEVVGSIPTEGSVIQGDVAQLVRASGS